MKSIMQTASHINQRLDRAGRAMDKWCVHRWVKQWNTHVDWFTATVFVALFALLGSERAFGWATVAQVSSDFAVVAAVYLGAVSLYNANQPSKLLMLLILLFVGAGIARFFGLLPIEGVTFLYSTGVVVTMVFLYKLSKRRCRQAWCVDFTDRQLEDACRVCGLRDRRCEEKEFTGDDRRKAMW